MSDRDEQLQRSFLVPFFLITFAITWGIGAFVIFLPSQVEAVLGAMTDTSLLYFVAISAPTISAILLTLLMEGRSGMGALFGRLVRVRFGIQWYALLLVGFPILGWLATRITGTTPLKTAATFTQFLLLLLYVLVTGPLCEELGWRGYALPRLLRRFNPFVSSLILGLIWGLWHLPSFFVSAAVQSGLSLPIFLFMALCSSFLITWIFQRTGGSVFVTVLFHFMMNFDATIIGVPLPAIASIVFTGAALVIIFDKDFGWFRPVQAFPPGIIPEQSSLAGE